MNDTLSQLRWPSLAQDLAVMTVPGSPITSLDAIYKTYNITEDELRDILKVPYFQQLFKNSLETFKAQGSKAGQIFRATSLSQALSEKLFTDALRGDMEAKDSLKLLELLMKGAGLFDKTDGGTQVNTQVNVGLNLPLPKGLRNHKLDHIANEQLT